jgi:hypothetical protein
MKIRFGITSPLLLQDETHAKLLLPHFVYQNFSIPDHVEHEVWIEGKTPMVPYNGAFSTSRQQDVFSVAGMISDHWLSENPLSITLSRSGAKEMWSNDPFNPGFAVTQSVVEDQPANVKRIVLVVDTSETMRNYIRDIQSAVQSLSGFFDVKLVIADTDLRPDLYGQDVDTIISELNRATLAGGADNAPALLKAWELAAQKPGNNAIVWIHGPQRLLLSPVDELKNRWERPYGPTLYSVQTTNGSDEIEKSLDGVEEVKFVPRTEQLQNDLENLFAQLTRRMPTLEFVRSSRKLDQQTEQFGGVHTSDHLARLWANDEVARLLAQPDTALAVEATTLAARYQLVTPVTGAVVLETAEQYRASGLEPVNPGTVPTIPEPEMVVLLIVAGAFMIWLMYMKYRKAGRGSCTV